MPLRRFRLPAGARPPLAVAGVAGTLAAIVATGPTAGLQPTATTTGPAPAARVAAARVPVTTPARVPLAGRVQLTRALRALDIAPPPRPAHASRSERRSPMHRWVRPNSGPLTSTFGYRWGRLHAGIDLAGPYGSPILAATDGCITYAGPMEGYGEVLEMTDWDGTQTVYGHMSAFVRHSGCVKAGTLIARVGAAGDATGPHLHFEVRVGGEPVDPIPFLAKRGVRV